MVILMYWLQTLDAEITQGRKLRALSELAAVADVVTNLYGPSYCISVCVNKISCKVLIDTG